MDIAFSVHLPVDSRSVPFVRGLCRQALEHLRVDRAVVEDVSLALTEACAHVVQHVGDLAEYEVHISVDDVLCRIGVVGDGLDLDVLSASEGPLGAAGGPRLMRALVDVLDVRQEPDGRQRLTLEKRLTPLRPLRLVDPV